MFRIFPFQIYFPNSIFIIMPYLSFLGELIPYSSCCKHNCCLLTTLIKTDLHFYEWFSAKGKNRYWERWLLGNNSVWCTDMGDLKVRALSSEGFRGGLSLPFLLRVPPLQEAAGPKPQWLYVLWNPSDALLCSWAK